MSVRGIRGAITVDNNSKKEILTDTEHLLKQLLTQNAIESDDVVSIFFSLTQDLDAEFPAIAARNLGLVDSPLLCLNEISVPGGLEKCVRILIHVNSPKTQKEMVHLYLKNAKILRPEFASNS
jgi:chorismate mutase